MDCYEYTDSQRKLQKIYAKQSDTLRMEHQYLLIICKYKNNYLQNIEESNKCELTICESRVLNLIDNKHFKSEISNILKIHE